MKTPVKTKKMYWESPYLSEITVKILKASPEGLILDQTIIYPGGGGQDRDFGFILKDDIEYPIIEVIKDETGLLHRMEGDGVSKFTEGEEVTLKIDWKRRYAHMKAHSSQHVFSAYLLDHYDTNTVDITLTPEEVTLVLDKEITYPQLQSALAGVLSLIAKDVRNIQSVVGTSEDVKRRFGSEVRGGIPDGDEVRVLTIDGWDMMCCGGTHVANTAEIGPIMVYKFNRMKEIRYFVGKKATDALAAVNISGLQAAASLSQSIENISPELDKRLSEIDVLRQTVKTLETHAIESLLASPGIQVENAIVKIIELPLNRKLLTNIIKKLDKNTVIAAKLPENMVMVLSTHKKAAAKIVMEKYIELFGGKGGGSPRNAQGKVTSEIQNFREASLQIITAILKVES